MKFKRIVLLALLVSVIIAVGFGIAQKTRSAYHGDGPYPATQGNYPSPAGVPLPEQVGNTSGIILGAIAIVVIIGAGVGYNYRVRGSEQ